MPELHNIQTHSKTTKDNLPGKIAKVRDYLKDTGFDSGDIDTYISQISWPTEPAKYHGWTGPETTVNGLKIFPTIMLWLRDSYSELQEDWVNFGIHLHTDAITIPHTQYYEPKATEIIWPLFTEFSKLFDDFGTFLTDEATDCMPWDSVVGFHQDRGLRTAFDLAFIPQSRVAEYADSRRHFKEIQHANGIFLIDLTKFQTRPWDY